MEILKPNTFSARSRHKIIFIYILVCSMLLTFLYLSRFNNNKSITLSIVKTFSFSHSNNTSPTFTTRENENLLTPGLMEKVYQSSKNSSLPPYADKKFLSDCSFKSVNRKNIFTMFKFWIKFAQKHNIIWFVSDGTLIGALRHNDTIPWDHDADVTILDDKEAIIREYQTPRGKFDFNTDHQCVMITRPGGYCVYTKGDRQNCRGNKVSGMSDVCSFCGPLARIITQNHVFFDIWRSRIETDKGQSKVSIETYYLQTGKRPLYPYDWIFPLKECKLMGLVVPCPNKPYELLNKVYGSTKPPKKCVNKSWKSQ